MQHNKYVQGYSFYNASTLHTRPNVAFPPVGQEQVKYIQDASNMQEKANIEILKHNFDTFAMSSHNVAMYLCIPNSTAYTLL